MNPPVPSGSLSGAAPNYMVANDAFRALAHPLRRGIVQRIAHGPATIGEATGRFGVSKPTITRHVKVLEDSGVVARTIDGRTHRLSLDLNALGEAVDWVDVRVGGSLRLVMRSPEGEEFGGRGQYVEMTPPERLVFTWRWDGHAGHEGVQLIEVELSERHDGTTTVVLTNRGLRVEEARRTHRAGWEPSFDNLDRVLPA